MLQSIAEFIGLADCVLEVADESAQAACGIFEFALDTGGLPAYFALVAVAVVMALGFFHGHVCLEPRPKPRPKPRPEL